jgi:hypothetical protein
MALQDRRVNPGGEWFKMKGNQEWDLAGLARQDGDHAAAARHTERARAYDRGEVPADVPPRDPRA